MSISTRIRVPVIVLAVLTITPGLALAQAACTKLFPAPATGAWAEWRQEGERVVRMSVVGEETREGKQLRWMEMRIVSGDASGMVVKFLVPGFPYDMQGVEEVVMKPAGQPAMKLSSQMLDMVRSQIPNDPTSDIFRRCEQVEQLGKESVTVPGGTFNALKVRDPESGDLAWVDPAVPFGMVKAQVKDGGTIVLEAHGTGATSAITETPQEIPGF